LVQDPYPDPTVMFSGFQDEQKGTTFFPELFVLLTAGTFMQVFKLFKPDVNVPRVNNK